jgi:hypothetical protein
VNTLDLNQDELVKEGEMGGTCGRHTRDMHAGFWWGNVRERDHFESLGVGWRIILEWILKTDDEQMWA